MIKRCGKPKWKFKLKSSFIEHTFRLTGRCDSIKGFI